jgi:hypothetical protein
MLTSELWNGGFFQPTGTAERNKGSDRRETALFLCCLDSDFPF